MLNTKLKYQVKYQVRCCRKYCPRKYQVTTALFDEYCNKCDLEFMARVSLKIRQHVDLKKTWYLTIFENGIFDDTRLGI